MSETTTADSFQAEAAAAAKLPNVHQAWAAVMADVRELGKHDRNTAPGAGFNFRGIDAVMNACGPILRRHQVAVVPTVRSANYRDVQTSTGKPSREATVMVDFTVYGPAGDSFAGGAPGEAMDHGDKGTAKAMSVAMRTFMLQALCLPTQDTDPDAHTYERAAGQAPAQETPEQAARRGIAQAQTLDALGQVTTWAQSVGVADAVREDAERRRVELQGGASA